MLQLNPKAFIINSAVGLQIFGNKTGYSLEYIYLEIKQGIVIFFARSELVESLQH